MSQTRQLYDSENRMRVSVEAVTAGSNVDIGATTEGVAATPSTASGLHGLIAGMWTALIAMSAKLPAALGSLAAASSLGVTASTEDVARVGIITEAVAATPSTSSGLHGLIGGMWTTLIAMSAKLPAALGSLAAASSLGVTASTEDIARAGIITEGAPATDTASSGQNGRLQRIAQRLTSLIALLPAALGGGGGLKVQLYDNAGTVLSFAGITGVQRLVSAANSNNATLVKNAAGFVFKVRVTNAVASIRYLKLYNKAVSPTVGSDTPFEVIQLPASSTTDVNYVDGLYFSAGIGFGLVTGATDVDNTSVTAADLTSLSIHYQ